MKLDVELEDGLEDRRRRLLREAVASLPYVVDVEVEERSPVAEKIDRLREARA